MMWPFPCCDGGVRRGPLQQAKERLQARKARPDREQVQDDVESALVAEIAHLNAITLQLHNKASMPLRNPAA